MPATICCTDCAGHGSYVSGSERVTCALCGGTGDGMNNPPFHTSDYWKSRYGRGASSGGGSRGDEALAKARIIDAVINDLQPLSVLDFGCGDGYVSTLVTRRVEQWIGYDPNVEGKDVPPVGQFDLVLSFDVLFHLPGDDEYHAYMETLFAYAQSSVLVWSTNHDNDRGHHHVRDRAWLAEVPYGWDVTLAIPDTGFERKGVWLLEKR